jgi:hypothetical protein
VNRHQDLIVARSETADPILRRAGSGVAHQGGALGGAGDECTKRLEREVRHPVLDLQCHQSRPGDPEVEAIIGLVARGLGPIVLRARLEPDMPVLRGRDLRCVAFITTDEASEKPTCGRGRTHPQQEMAHHRHSVAAENEPLNIIKLQSSGLRRIVPLSPK